jgi:hypothetical protein
MRAPGSLPLARLVWTRGGSVRRGADAHRTTHRTTASQREPPTRNATSGVAIMSRRPRRSRTDCPFWAGHASRIAAQNDAAATRQPEHRTGDMCGAANAQPFPDLRATPAQLPQIREARYLPLYVHGSLGTRPGQLVSLAQLRSMPRACRAMPRKDGDRRDTTRAVTAGQPQFNRYAQAPLADF